MVLKSSIGLPQVLRMSSGAASYRHAKIGEFFQAPPVLHNPFKDDPVLMRTLRRLLSEKDYPKVENDLCRFGERITSEIDHLGRMCELNPPKLEHFDAWGRRADQLIACSEWNRLKKICAEEGLICGISSFQFLCPFETFLKLRQLSQTQRSLAFSECFLSKYLTYLSHLVSFSAIGYDDDSAPTTRRIHQFAKIYLFAASSGLTTCPMAMTDGAVKTLKALGLYGKHDLATEAVDRLRSTDGNCAWTSGQWMTEKAGGSDVAGGCDTYAEHIGGDKYRLYGYKWFSSAIDADIALTLARIVDGDGNATKGTRGLSLFLLKIRNEDGGLNAMQMIRLKNKFGTKQLPTAELLLDGTIAHCIGAPGRGVANISNMLNTTRIHNAVSSVSFVRRAISLARDYATRRVVFGKTQDKWPLHLSTLAKMEVETRGCFLLMMEAARLLGASEESNASDSDAAVLRIVTPVVKLYTGKICVPLISEAMECFGGIGYMEDSGIPCILRDAQVTPIWEGTTNVLALDVLRVLTTNPDTFALLRTRIESVLPSQVPSELERATIAIRAGLDSIEKFLQKALERNDQQGLEASARQLAFGIARTYAGALLVHHAADTDATGADMDVALRWCSEQPMVDLKTEWLSGIRINNDHGIVFENFSPALSNSKL